MAAAARFSQGRQAQEQSSKLSHLAASSSELDGQGNGARSPLDSTGDTNDTKRHRHPDQQPA